jgi:hypothetical protein
MTSGVCSCLGKQLSRHSVLKQQIRHTSSTHDRCLLAISIELPLYRNVFSIASYCMLCTEGLQGVRKIHLRQRTTGDLPQNPVARFERGTLQCIELQHYPHTAACSILHGIQGVRRVAFLEIAMNSPGIRTKAP